MAFLIDAETMTSGGFGFVEDHHIVASCVAYVFAWAFSRIVLSVVPAGTGKKSEKRMKTCENDEKNAQEVAPEPDASSGAIVTAEEGDAESVDAEESQKRDAEILEPLPTISVFSPPKEDDMARRERRMLSVTSTRFPLPPPGFSPTAVLEPRKSVVVENEKGCIGECGVGQRRGRRGLSVVSARFPLPPPGMSPRITQDNIRAHDTAAASLASPTQPGATRMLSSLSKPSMLPPPQHLSIVDGKAVLRRVAAAAAAAAAARKAKAKAKASVPNTRKKSRVRKVLSKFLSIRAKRAKRVKSRTRSRSSWTLLS